ncbi:MAG: Two-component system response regulator [Acidimicrobiales bacterium]|nr:Two-component system response regulator [Acidimicrobiales bacterium]
MKSPRRTAEAQGGRRWSVGGYLAAIVVVVVLVFACVGAALGHQTWQSAQQRVRANGTYLAGVAAKTVAENKEAAAQQVVAVAANPGVPALFEDPSRCSFQFALELFPGSHLDLVRPDGTILCSSAELEAGGASYAGETWLGQSSAEQPGFSEPFVDPVTGQNAVALASAISGPDGEAIGSAVVVVPTTGIAQPITETIGGVRQYQFSIVDQDAKALLSKSDGMADVSPEAGSVAATDPMAKAGFLYGSERIAGTDWVVSAGAHPETVLGPTRSVLLRGASLGGLVLLVLLASLMVVSRKIARPLRDLTSAVAGTGPNVDEQLAAIDGPAEVSRLAEGFRTAIDARSAYEAQLSHQALHDPLTGLPNRALLAERLPDAIDRALRTDASLAVLFLDLDRFKLVNDSLGHDVGDQVLVTTAGRLRDLVPPGGILARFGGDEFVVVTEVHSAAELDELVQALLDVVDDPIETRDAVVRITASIGIATSAPHRRPHDLIRDADNAMYAAKEQGRGRAERYDVRLYDRASERLTLASEFRVALDRGELHLAYQPKIHLATGDIVGVEALLRWDHPALGSIPPSTFIPIAEETDAILPVGTYVLETACLQATAWRDQGIDLTMAVNISGRQLANGNLPADVAAVLSRTGLEPEALYLELTESLLMSDTIANQRTLSDLQTLGVHLSIDDFGTGYSSLAYLHRFPVDELKIDRSFINDLANPSNPAPLVSAMIAMGNALGLTTVAEGVESQEQAVRLQTIGCDTAQGYFFARPQVADALTPLLRPALQAT